MNGGLKIKHSKHRATEHTQAEVYENAQKRNPEHRKAVENVVKL